MADITDEAVFERASAEHTELLVQLMREFYDFEHLPWDGAAARSALGMALDDPALSEVWLIRRSGEAAGYFVLGFGFSLEFRGRFALLDELYLREPFRGGGLGRRAIRHAEEVCRARGIEALRLEVEHKNAGAQAFYRAVGFEGHERYLLTRWIPG
ncbi:MAG: GNAT family N-acetyltransferase [Gemmatimonadetes bacterium]|nr:GNAT family N-acetyltransferase [Gemmatimonadota bacterium]